MQGWFREEWRGDPFSALRSMVVASSRPVEWSDAEAAEWRGRRRRTCDLRRPVDWVGAYGLVCYDAGRASSRSPTATLDDLRIPDLDVIFPTRWLCFDHRATG